MTKISATIVADSINEQGDRLTSFLITFPRILLSEINTHRMLSKNTSSSRAIPFSKMVETIKNDPFIPIAWQKEHKGMQGSEYFGSELFETHKPSNWRQPIDAEEDETYVEVLTAEWLMYRDSVVEDALRLNSLGVTKQLCNRLLEPFMWTTMLITGPKSGWDNFFNLRCSSYEIKITSPKEFEGQKLSFKSKKEFLEFGDNKKLCKNWTELDWLKANKGQAEIHMMALAESIYDAVNESTPKKLIANQWHVPFRDKMDETLIEKIYHPKSEGIDELLAAIKKREESVIKISVALSARTSYTVVGEEKALDYEALIGLHDRLLAQDPPHSSPLEHCCRALTNSEYYNFVKGNTADNRVNRPDIYGWVNNIKGFMPYRYLVDNKLSL